MSPVFQNFHGLRSAIRDCTNGGRICRRVWLYWKVDFASFQGASGPAVEKRRPEVFFKKKKKKECFTRHFPRPGDAARRIILDQKGFTGHRIARAPWNTSLLNQTAQINILQRRQRTLAPVMIGLVLVANIEYETSAAGLRGLKLHNGYAIKYLQRDFAHALVHRGCTVVRKQKRKN